MHRRPNHSPGRWRTGRARHRRVDAQHIRSPLPRLGPATDLLLPSSTATASPRSKTTIKHLPPISVTMRPSCLLSLTKRIRSAHSTPRTDVAQPMPSVEPSFFSSLEYQNTYMTTLDAVGADGPRHDAFEDNATPPGIAQGCHLLHPRTTMRVPDLEKVRFVQPEEWLEELCNPSLVLGVPAEFAAPRPTYARKIGRENVAAIVDQEWEYNEGEVRLVNTNQVTVVERLSVSNHSLP